MTDEIDLRIEELKTLIEFIKNNINKNNTTTTLFIILFILILCQKVFKYVIKPIRTRQTENEQNHIGNNNDQRNQNRDPSINCLVV